MHPQMLDCIQLWQTLQGRPIAPKGVGHDLLRWRTRMIEQLTNETLRRIPLILQGDVQHLAVLIDGPPQVDQLVADRHKDLVQMPGAARPPFAPAQFGGEVRAKLLHPCTDGLVSHESPRAQKGVPPHLGS